MLKESYLNNWAVNSTIAMLLIMLFLVSPVLCFIVSFLMIFVLRYNSSNEKIIALFVSLGFATLAFLYDPHYELVGDVINYYKEFHRFTDFNFLDANHLFKSLYFLTIFLIKQLSNNEQWLNFIMIFFTYFIFFKGVNLIRRKENLSSNVVKLSLLFFLIMFNPEVLFKSSRNTLAYIVFSIGLLYDIYNYKMKSYFIFIISVLIHISLILPLFIYVFVDKRKLITKAVRKSIPFMITVASVLFLLARFNLIGTVQYYYQAKIGSYLYEGFAPFFGSIYSLLTFYELILKVVLILLLISSIKYIDIKTINGTNINKYFNFCKLYFIISLISIFNRTLFIRNIGSGIIIYLYLFILVFYYSKNRYKKILIGVLILSLFTRSHLGMFVGNITIGPGLIKSVFMSIKDIFNYEISLPF